ncbi:hypothetical protein AB0O76_04780 [Streptomyces sp. NPDC086554]|uniref:hypothetical protein n=1 Tax=Streptomyces sp. NPDC086554 TaxID=3154864 RepID=UPI0034417D95
MPSIGAQQPANRYARFSKGALSLLPEIPTKSVGSPVDVLGAELVRDKWRDGELRTRVHGAHVAGGSSYGNEIIIADRDALKRLIDDLQGCYRTWPH